MVADVRWSKDLVRKMVEVRLALILSVNERDVWTSLFRDDAFEVVWSHTEGMPREVIRLAVKCVEMAQQNAHKHVTVDDLIAGLHLFSEERLDDLSNDMNRQYPGLASVVRGFKGGHKEFDLERVQEVGMMVTQRVSGTPHENQYGWAMMGLISR